MNDTAVIQAISQRRLPEVLHFTTNNGLVGILRTSRLSANAFLRAEQQLAHILRINSIDRSRDSLWLEYVNLSISRINDYFFGYSKKLDKHEHAYWCILGFDPEIMAHPGVHFATTNNAYSLTLRATGALGLDALFAERIRRKPGWTVARSPHEAPHYTTCRQAEVLYPGHVSLKHLRAIYVMSGEAYDEVFAQVSLLAPHLLAHIEITVDPRKFN
jgi:hypothetical protein